MSFLDELEVIREEIFDIDLNFPAPSESIGYRNCEWIMINDSLYLSIQASKLHYCFPREHRPLDEYTHFELAIIIDGELSNNTSVFKGFKRYEELMRCWELGIFAYVDKELLEDLYTYCKEELQD